MVCVVLIVLVLPAAAVGQTLANLSIYSPLQRAGEEETWTVQFDVPATGGNPGGVRDLSNFKVKTTFPDGYAVAASSACQVEGATGVTTSVFGLTITCTIGSGSFNSGAQLVTHMSHVTAPSVSGTTGTFLVEFINAVGVVEADHGSNKELIVANLLQSVSISAGDPRAGETTSYNLAFTPKNLVGTGGDVRLVFPTGFGIQADAACSIAGLTGISFTRTSATEGVCNLNGASLGAGTAYTLQVTRVKNPPHSVEGTAMLAQTRNAQNAIHDEKQDVSLTVDAHPFSQAPTASAASDSAGAVTTYTFTFAPFNPWPADGGLKIAFPQGFQLNAGGTSLITVVSGADGTLDTPTVQGVQLTALRTGGTPVNLNQPVTISVSNVKNPIDPIQAANAILATITSLLNEIDKGLPPLHGEDGADDPPPTGDPGGDPGTNPAGSQGQPNGDSSQTGPGGSPGSDGENTGDSDDSREGSADGSDSLSPEVGEDGVLGKRVAGLPLWIPVGALLAVGVAIGTWAGIHRLTRRRPTTGTTRTATPRQGPESVAERRSREDARR